MDLHAIVDIFHRVTSLAGTRVDHFKGLTCGPFLHEVGLMIPRLGVFTFFCLLWGVKWEQHIYYRPMWDHHISKCHFPHVNGRKTPHLVQFSTFFQLRHQPSDG